MNATRSAAPTELRRDSLTDMSSVPAILAGAAVVALALATPDSPIWHPFLLIVGPIAAAWVVRGHSLLVSLALVQLSIYYGIPTLLLDQQRPPALVSLVALWAAGMMLGCLLSGARTAPTGTRQWKPPGAFHICVVGALIAIQAIQVLTGQIGFEAQLVQGQSTPPGLLTTLATAAPVLTSALLVTALSSGRRLPIAAAFAAVEVLVLSLSGFRGAGVLFVLSAIILGALMLPRESRWRRGRRNLVVVPFALSLILLAFVAGAVVKNSVATDLGMSSSGTRLIDPEHGVSAIASRLDNSEPLQHAILKQNSLAVQDAVDWRNQLVALIPRALWPDKPTVDYGQEVRVAVYGIEYGNSSASITVIGDTLVNFGRFGVVFFGVILGLSVSLLEGVVRRGTGPFTVILGAVLAQLALSSESTVILMSVAAIRQLLICGAIWMLVEHFARRNPGENP